MAEANTTEIPTHIDDVVSYLKCCSDTFGQIAAILSAIERDEKAFSNIRKLAGAGHYMAQDFENMADCWREEIKENGIRTQ